MSVSLVFCCRPCADQEKSNLPMSHRLISSGQVSLAMHLKRCQKVFHDSDFQTWSCGYNLNKAMQQQFPREITELLPFLVKWSIGARLSPEKLEGCGTCRVSRSLHNYTYVMLCARQWRTTPRRFSIALVQRLVSGAYFFLINAACRPPPTVATSILVQIFDKFGTNRVLRHQVLTTPVHYSLVSSIRFFKITSIKSTNAILSVTVSLSITPFPAVMTFLSGRVTLK